MNQWYHLSVKSRRGGKEEQKTVGAQREKQNKNKEGKVWGEGVAGQGWDQGRVVGMVQSSTPSILIFKFFFKSLTPPHHQAQFSSDWEMQGHQKLQTDHWTIVGSCCRSAEGMFATPEYMLQFTHRRWKERI